MLSLGQALAGRDGLRAIPSRAAKARGEQGRPGRGSSCAQGLTSLLEPTATNYSLPQDSKQLALSKRLACKDLMVGSLQQ